MFECECLKCGHKMQSDKHCREIKCPECGGEMRRVNRPGIGAEDANGNGNIINKNNVNRRNFY